MSLDELDDENEDDNDMDEAKVNDQPKNLNIMLGEGGTSIERG